MAEGRVIRSHSDIHYVAVTGRAVACRARGKFRLGESTRPVLVGDRVHVTLTGDSEGRIDAIMPRQNELSRPPVANVDQALVVFTLKEPEKNLLLLDRFLVHTTRAGVAAVVVLNKVDVLSAAEVADFVRLYTGLGYPVLPISATESIGLGNLLLACRGRTSVLAGQSGAGKSALIRALVPEHGGRIGPLSERLKRGRHTTRHIELVPIGGGGGGLLVDTPGFTYLDFEGVTRQELATLFPEFRSAPREACRFHNCLHRAEPDCGVKQAVEAGKIPRHRHEHYLTFLAEIEEQRRW